MNVKSALYNLVIRKHTTVQYGHLLGALPEGAEVLDVGVGNGVMLDHYADTIRQKGIRIEGIDIDRPYLEACRKRIEKHGLGDLVSCSEADVAELLAEREALPRFVYFGASFMLLPDPEGVLALLREKLPPDGRVMFAQALLDRRNRLVEWVKPKLKYVTSVDFGRAMYRDELLGRLEQAGFELAEETELERLSGNLRVFFHAFKAGERAS